ncbi:VWA domain-containing protein [Candidatus Chloroploca sp. Khr17]|uniref:VWA domain-containing protein n=1 Tax=Candidatus Chloroploca sp. Khr17 TaxID=2496869 RepID=UPI00101CA949|nr:VWA domain-containing protein [Candidatus Chloroploca sp. Khr17]
MIAQKFNDGNVLAEASKKPASPHALKRGGLRRVPKGHAIPKGSYAMEFPDVVPADAPPTALPPPPIGASTPQAPADPAVLPPPSPAPCDEAALLEAAGSLAALPTEDAWLSDGIAPTAIQDGSQVLRHDGYDVQAWQTTLAQLAALQTLVTNAATQVVTGPALVADLFWSVFKRAPMIAPVAPLRPAYQWHEPILSEIMQTVEWAHLRAAGTLGDPLASALATMGLARAVLASLDATTCTQVADLNAHEAAAAAWLDRAATLTELAQEARDARRQPLLAEAQHARAAANAAQQAAATLADALQATAPTRAATARRASRAALDTAAAELTTLHHALAAFGGGGTSHGGPGGLAAAGDLPTTFALAEQISQNPRLRQLATLCGRFTQIALAVQTSRVAHPTDELTSITTGHDLGRLLPSELALLTTPALEDRFMLHYAEQRLMQYDLVGHERQGRGPIIVALDSSGSMAEPGGSDGLSKEVWAKAVTLALLSIARRQRRDMVVMHFAGTPELAVFPFAHGQATPSEVLTCLNYFNGGGTRFEPWMQHALTLIDQATYDRADVICLSDGLTHLDPALSAAWHTRRTTRGMRVFSVLIGTTEGADVLAALSDHLFTLTDLQDDQPVLRSLFAL